MARSLCRNRAPAKLGRYVATEQVHSSVATTLKSFTVAAAERATPAAENFTEDAATVTRMRFRCTAGG
ncbi:hypothetical protein F2Q70_00015634 [Brassica cretica]|uniref:Uncharacterized protein n=1 Tax=Brassica cretica TaxID=69181 RepID=A0A8S9HU35_BRACR|nr:hypothetical protein F2Q70_00015634 [Brassica cretica]